jgi:hypothetical protein
MNIKNFGIPTPPMPKLPPPIEQYRTTKEQALLAAKEARLKLFETEKGKTYYAIDVAANKGSFTVEYKFPENCNSYDVQSLQNELISAGFKAEYRYGLYGDTLDISWYPEK